MITPFQLIKQQRPGWEFWVALPVTLASLIPLVWLIISFFKPNLDLAGLLLLIAIPLMWLINCGYAYMQYKLAFRSFTANIFAAFLVPIGYYEIADKLFAIFEPGPNYTTTTVKTAAATTTYSNDVDKMYQHVGNWPMVFMAALFITYLISAIRVRRHRHVIEST